jgi:hypothetical protein
MIHGQRQIKKWIGVPVDRGRGCMETYSYCSGWAGCEPCRGWRDCGNGRFEGPRAPAEVHDLSFQDDWNGQEGERPRASPSRN